MSEVKKNFKQIKINNMLISVRKKVNNKKAEYSHKKKRKI